MCMVYMHALAGRPKGAAPVRVSGTKEEETKKSYMLCQLRHSPVSIALGSILLGPIRQQNSP